MLRNKLKSKVVIANFHQTLPMCQEVCIHVLLFSHLLFKVLLNLWTLVN